MLSKVIMIIHLIFIKNIHEKKISENLHIVLIRVFFVQLN